MTGYSQVTDCVNRCSGRNSSNPAIESQIIGAIEGMKVDLLEDVTMVDLYEPEGEAVRNVTVRLTYRHAKKTLKDKEVDKRHSKVVEGLLKALPVRV